MMTPTTFAAMLQILAMFPVTTAISRRSFSTMKKLFAEHNQ